MNESAGQVSLELILKSYDFQRELTNKVNEAVNKTNESLGNVVDASDGLTGSFKKLGTTIASAFAIKEMAEFARNCIELGSDLTEVQNVVDVTFQDMTSQVNDWAKSAMNNFGLSETAAKKYASTFGAMSKSFGFTTKEAAAMGETLTGLTADVASFYNLSTDLAYIKLKSVFTGETESLKDLGVVMTQSALDAFALANGFGKTTSEMTEAEKVALRYAFVQDKLKDSAGDFQRTSSSWANQTKILKQQIDAIKTSLGQMFIQVLTPVINALNSILAKIRKVVDAFASMLPTGGNNAFSGVSDALGQSEESSGQLTNNISDSIAAAKELKRTLMGFDEINKLADNSLLNNSGGSDLGGIPKISGLDNLNMTADIKTNAGEVSKIFDKLKQKVDELKSAFKKGWDMGFKDFDLSPIFDNISRIKEALSNIFNNKDLQNAVNTYVMTFAETLGTLAGSFARMGASVAEWLTGGIAGWLEQDGEYISSMLTSIFNVKTEGLQDVQAFATAIADIVEDVLTFDSTVDILSDTFSILSTTLLNVWLLLEKFGTDLFELVTQPIIDNKAAITTALQGLMSFFSSVISTIKQAIQETWESIQKVYDEHISPLIDKIKNGISELVALFLEKWNDNVQPVLDNIGKKSQELWDDYLSPLKDNIADLVGSISDLLGALWDTDLQPKLKALVTVLVPAIAIAAESIYNNISGLIMGISDLLSWIMKDISNFVKVLTDLTNGDWSQALADTSAAFKDSWDGLKKFAVDIPEIAYNITGGDAIANAVKRAVENTKEKATDSGSGVNRYANGGYIKADSPQLAIVGDNKSEGEIIAPESKISEAVAVGIHPVLASIELMAQNLKNSAKINVNMDIPSGSDYLPQIKLADSPVTSSSNDTFSDKKSGSDSDVMQVMAELLRILKDKKDGGNDDDKIINVYVGNEMLDTYIQKSVNRSNYRSGGRL